MMLKEIIVASTNKGKIKEFGEILGGRYTLKTLAEIGFTGDIPETENTFLGNALLKARFGFKMTGKPCLADDSGLCVTALDNAPGVYSARYAGESCRTEDNISLLLKNLKGKKDRSAKFVACMVLCFNENDYLTAFGETQGIILEGKIGTSGFGYDPIFFSNELQKSFGKATPEEKHPISHRGRALKDLLTQLQKRAH